MFDLVFTMSAILAVSGVSAVGVLALPWTDGEIAQTHDALRAVGALARRWMHHPPGPLAPVAAKATMAIAP
jgi:hypothetical protein